MGNKYRHLQLIDRLEIKKQLDNNISVIQIAKNLGYTKNAIYSEIKRGSVDGNYEPNNAEAIAKGNTENKGAPSLLERNPFLASHIAKMILSDGMSVPEIANYLSTHDEPNISTISRNTIYGYIDKRLIPGVSKESLRTDNVKMFSGNMLCVPKWACQKYGFKNGDIFSINFSADGEIIFKKKR
ncbi:Helix-turn-helix domain protein [anaerobic digester metagenome]